MTITFVIARTGLWKLCSQRRGVDHQSHMALCSVFKERPRHASLTSRSLGRVSVPVWLVVLSDQLAVVALVGHYPTNKLIAREPLPKRNSFPHLVMRPGGGIRY